MATTPHPLVWDFYRTVEGAEGLGGVVHYYDEMSQSLWLSSGIKTNLADIPEGHWKAAEIQNSSDIGTPAYTSLSLDHAYNGVLFGVATLGSALVYLRYLYAFDCSDIVSSGTLSYSNSNAVVQLKANLMNIKDVIFSSDSTLFQPGAKVTLKALVGDEIPYDMCVTYLDSVDYSVKSSTIPISGRNNIGFKLNQSTFDDQTEISGLPHEVAAKIMELAGVENYVIQEGTDNREHQFNADQTLLSGLQQLCDFYQGWKVVELPNGTIIVGYPSFVNSYQGNGYYVFDEGSVFKRRTKRSSDAAYTKVRVTGKDLDDKDLNPVSVAVKNYVQWNLPPNKTYHEAAPDGLTQAELQEYAETLAESLQYVGIGEDFTGSLQPHLVIGDVAAIDQGDNTMLTLGVVTSIKHSFGKSGFTTDFSTDSGGVMMETLASDGAITTVTKSLNGYTRKQTLKDLIQVASSPAVAGSPAAGTVIKVVTSSNAATLEGKTYSEIIADTTFKPGSSVSLSQLVLLGEVLSGGTGLRWNLFLGRPISAGSISVTSCTITATQGEAYLVGDDFGSAEISGSIEVSSYSQESGLITLTYTPEVPWDSTTLDSVLCRVETLSLNFGI